MEFFSGILYNQAWFVALCTALNIVFLTFVLEVFTDSIKNFKISKMTIQGDAAPVKNYEVIIDVKGANQRLTEDRTSTGVNASGFEPEALKGVQATSAPNFRRTDDSNIGVFDYDQDDGIEPVDRPLFKPKE